MKLEIGTTQSGLAALEDLNDFSYENIFNVYLEAHNDGDKMNPSHFAYNILKAVKMPPDIDPESFVYVEIVGKIAWTQLSFLEYGTIRLWWLICITNGILNPVTLPEPGSVIKVIKPAYVKTVISTIKSQIKSQ